MAVSDTNPEDVRRRIAGGEGDCSRRCDGSALADRYFVDAHHLGPGVRHAPAALPCHCLSSSLTGYILDRRMSGTPTNKERKVLGEMRIVGQEFDCSRFTLPLILQRTRRTSSSRYMRVSPHDR